MTKGPVGAEQRAVWLQIATAVLVKIVTVKTGNSAADVVHVTPKADGNDGAASMAAQYADALFDEYRKRDTSQ